ncbi:MAG: NFACT family protein [Candidatus Micrarchaeia archaeon]
MQKMSGLDLKFAVSEIAHLEGKRLAKIRKTESGVFLFKIGSEEMLFEPGVRLHLTRQALVASERPEGFTSFLRKNFEGKTAQSIKQYGTDRIVEIETRSKEKLVFELFRKGNLIAVGEDGVIVACLEKEEAGGRRIARGEKYAYPKATSFEFKVPPKIAFVVQENDEGEPSSYSLDAAKGGKEFPSFSEALDFYFANQKSESEEERKAARKLEALSSRLAGQEEALAKLGVEKARAKEAGDAIWNDLERIDALASLVREMKKAGKSEAEINAALQGRKAKLSGSELELEV